MRRIDKRLMNLDLLIGKYDDVIVEKKTIASIIGLSIVTWVSSAAVWSRKNKTISAISAIISIIQSCKLVYWLIGIKRSTDIKNGLVDIKMDLEDEVDEFIDLDLEDI